MKLGLIGIGAIGSGVAACWLEKGFEVHGFDTDKGRLAAFVAEGGKACSGVADVAQKAEAVFTSLPSTAASLAVAREIATAGHARYHVELSTVGRETMREIATIARSAGLGFVDSPVSGASHAAREGRLSAVMAGDPAVIEAVRPAVEAFTKAIFVVGTEPGLAQVCKIVNNILSITAFVASCEAITLGVAAGGDAKAMLDFINESTGRNSATVDKFPRAILPRSFDYGGPTDIGVKDLGLFLDLARETGMPTPLGSTVANLFTMAARELDPDADYSRLINVFENWAGVELKAYPGKE